MIWQLHDSNEWRFGEMVRGVVRKPYYAEIYYDEERGWVWLTSEVGPCGVEGCFEDALKEAEAVLEERGLIHK